MQESKADHTVRDLNVNQAATPSLVPPGESVPGTGPAEQDRTETMKLLGHEIKTPLCLAKLYLQMAQRLPDQHTDQLRYFINRATEQIDTITKITDDFAKGFDCPLSDAGMVPYRFDMVLLITETIGEAVLLYPGYNFDVLGVKTAWVKAERHKIKQVVNNYLSNAVKYSCGSKKVLINCKTTPEAVTVTVKDFGTGIEAGLTEKIFQRFYRIRTAGVENTEGNGYGLFVVSEIIGQHRGKVGVRSICGQGSEFYFSLPATDGGSENG
ncbi:HAMP domain-containing histidine kinase [Mucilaginibacter pallidiroseus]|uniref:histidine kinase n=1 Tax=Mucilaginibacter pallidiroseus TaxID=2599295 RepID=A0A563TZ29_9SPHI|nr:HAMP domain-containing sensor histidine kinase [Mucilaginibacter pallidiroseus]TWR24390.1 HAMP domain-containing histidine kinase [Mucilaginibacter pallidiroseus]